MPPSNWAEVACYAAPPWCSGLAFEILNLATAVRIRSGVQGRTGAVGPSSVSFSYREARNGEALNKSDLVATVSLETGFSKRVTADAIDAILEAVRRTVARGERVSLPGFGTFEKRLRAPRTARNPRTGERVPVPAMHVPVFRPGRDFKDACVGKRERFRRR